MRILARAAISSLVVLCVALALVVVAVAAIGFAGTRSAASQGNAIAGDELTSAIVTGQLARDIDAAPLTATPENGRSPTAQFAPWPVSPSEMEV